MEEQSKPKKGKKKHKQKQLTAPPQLGLEVKRAPCSLSLAAPRSKTPFFGVFEEGRFRRTSRFLVFVCFVGSTLDGFRMIS